MKIGGPQITLLASDHPQMAHSSTPGPFFIPNLLCLRPPYTPLTPCIFKKRKGGSQKLTFLALLVQDFLQAYTATMGYIQIVVLPIAIEL
eukprot:1157437-Pelagomonas_calceolata.AAC.10